MDEMILLQKLRSMDYSVKPAPDKNAIMLNDIIELNIDDSGNVYYTNGREKIIFGNLSNADVCARNIDKRYIGIMHEIITKRYRENIVETLKDKLGIDNRFTFSVFTHQRNKRVLDIYVYPYDNKSLTYITMRIRIYCEVPHMTMFIKEVSLVSRDNVNTHKRVIEMYNMLKSLNTLDTFTE